jgi:hypothetical protein
MEPSASHISRKPCAVNRDLSLAQRYAEVREGMNLKFVRQAADPFLSLMPSQVS